ncbi:unnamed protein product [Effrenium voratum]|uniref:S1 motif domain-containing protein n=1 Tax=Effrenium voratum TaxID=2562239 RepID=A0AA36JHQ0_9DINO|nr:unnamed protein product [Effrenium voratum]
MAGSDGMPQEDEGMTLAGGPQPVKAKARPKSKAKAKAKAKAKVKVAKAKPKAQAKTSKKAKPRETKAAARSFARRSVGKASGKRPREKKADPAPKAKSGEMDDSSECATPNVSEAQKLLGGPSLVAQDLAGWVARQVGLDSSHVGGAVRLFQDGATLPFIARYRKEQTGAMGEEALRRVERELARATDLERRRGRVAAALHRGQNLTPSLQETLLQAETVEAIDALWAPFKAKKKTRAQVAKDHGLEPLATFLAEAAKGAIPVLEALKAKAPMEPIEPIEPIAAEQPAAAAEPIAGEPPAAAEPAAAAEPIAPAEPIAAAAAQFVSQEVPDISAALAAARDILAEQLAHRADIRHKAREILERKVTFSSRRKAGADIEERFKTYWDFAVPMWQVKAHQFLAVQRGENAKCLSLNFTVTPEDLRALQAALLATFLGKSAAIAATPTPLRHDRLPWDCRAACAEISAALEDATKRLLLPSLQREWRRRLKDRSEDEAFDTFRRNLKKKLLTPPLRLHPAWGASPEAEPTILGLDPAFRTGCKCALITSTGQVLATKTIFLHQAQAASAGLWELLSQGLGPAECPDTETASEPPAKRRKLSARVVCSLGNGTGSRETEQWLRQHLKEEPRVGYSVVDEAGASVYSASRLAGAELPALDVALRGAVSIARRLLDPLSELVKIDPRSIGVGLYQHDVDQKRLQEELRSAVQDAVNCVGVDLNTASPALLEHVAGLNASRAQSILRQREELGRFNTLSQLRKVKGLGPKCFQQAAGFLRVFQGGPSSAPEPLDALPIHPESYEAARALQRRGNGALQDLSSEVASELGVGLETLRDICTALIQAGTGDLDPRCREPAPRIKSVGSVPQAGAALDAQEAGITVEQLKPQMVLAGIVKNVVAFGAFVDLGVGCDGLLHVSKFAAVPPSVNDQLEVVVLSTERRQEKGKDKWRVSLAMK